MIKIQWKTNALALLLGIAATSAVAAERDFEHCRQLFLNGNPPIIKHHDELMPRALCFNAFAVLHSGNSRTPIYVVQRINKEQVEAQVTRATRFYADARLPKAERAELDEYRGSGFDRGHMALAGDMATDESMA